MTCDTSQVVYRIATIAVDLHGVKDDARILDELFHELCHVLHADFRNYQAIVQAFAFDDDDSRIIHAEQKAWTMAAESFVMRMEWIWRNHLRELYLDRFTGPPSPGGPGWTAKS